MLDGDIRAIFPDGSDEVLPASIALRKAQAMGLDLILTDPHANPPVAKATDYGGWQYDQKKEKRHAKRHQRIVPLKQLRFSPAIAARDYQTKLNQAIRLLEQGNEVRLVAPSQRSDILQRLADDLRTFGTPQGNPQLQGAEAFLTIRPESRQSPFLLH